MDEVYKLRSSLFMPWYDGTLSKKAKEWSLFFEKNKRFSSGFNPNPQIKVAINYSILKKSFDYWSVQASKYIYHYQ